MSPSLDLVLERRALHVDDRFRGAGAMDRDLVDASLTGVRHDHVNGALAIVLRRIGSSLRRARLRVAAAPVTDVLLARRGIRKLERDIVVRATGNAPRDDDPTDAPAK